MIGTQEHGLGDVASTQGNDLATTGILALGVVFGRGPARHDAFAASLAAAFGVAAVVVFAPSVACASDEVAQGAGLKGEGHCGAALGAADRARLWRAQRFEASGEGVFADVVGVSGVLPQLVGERGVLAVFARNEDEGGLACAGEGDIPDPAFFLVGVEVGAQHGCGGYGERGVAIGLGVDGGAIDEDHEVRLESLGAVDGDDGQGEVVAPGVFFDVGVIEAAGGGGEAAGVFADLFG